MALVRIDHYEGYGDSYLARVSGFRPNDPDAVEHAAEYLAERIGRLRGYPDGDGYGYINDYGDGEFWVSLDIHCMDDGEYLVTQDWYKLQPTGHLTMTKVRHYGDGAIRFSATDDDGRRWERWQSSPDNFGQWISDPDDGADEYWRITLVDRSEHNRDLIQRARRNANLDPKWRARYGEHFTRVDVIDENWRVGA